MGPRLQERGVRFRACVSGWGLAELQWGRAYKSAELGSWKPLSRHPPPLQWGRAYKSAELRPQASFVPPAKIRFNGAALTRARSLTNQHNSLRDEEKLQWGRAYKSAELERKRRYELRDKRFNGAALTRARSLSFSEKRRERERSFNGAALTRARSSEESAWIEKCSNWLQWGRAYKSAEFGSGMASVFPPLVLQWGRAYKSAELTAFGSSKNIGQWASMGPRLQERGVRHLGIAQALRMRSFNGAALTRARSSFGSSKNVGGWQRLQWGRAYKSAELAESGSKRSEAESGFNGAALTRARSLEEERVTLRA